MKHVRLGIIGLGAMGQGHARNIHPVELANAILLSSRTDRAVELPFDSAVYARWLERKIAASPRTKRLA